MPAKKESNITIEINPQWLRHLCNVNMQFSIKDTIAYVERLEGGGKTQVLIALGEHCLRQMKE